MTTTGELRSHDSVTRQWLLLLNRLPFLPANRAVNICLFQCDNPTLRTRAKIWTGDPLLDGDAGFREDPFIQQRYDALLYKRPVSAWIKLVNLAS